MRIKHVLIAGLCLSTNMQLVSTRSCQGAVARITKYYIVRQVSGYNVSDLHYYSYTATYSSSQIAAYRTIKNISNTGYVQNISYWQTSGSGDFTNPTPPISCPPHSPTYQLHVYICENLAAPGEPNIAEDFKDASGP